MKLKTLLTAAIALLTVTASAQTTAPFNVDISLASWTAISNAWVAHQTACATSSNYVGRTVTRTLVVTNEATGEGYMTNIVKRANTAVSWQKFRLMCMEKMGMEGQLVEAAQRIGDNAARYTSAPIVATNSSPGTVTDKDN